MSDLKEKILTEFKRFEKSLNGSASTEIHTIRTNAKKYFAEIGFPDRKMEEWRFTDIKPIVTGDFNFEFTDSEAEFSKKDFEKFLIPGLNANLIVLINGNYSKKYSEIISKGAGVVISNLNDVYKTNKDLIENNFSKFVSYNSDGFTAMNTAFAKDGAFIYIPKNTELKEPVMILNISDARKEHVISQPRNLIIAEEGSNSSVIEIYYSLGKNNNFSNTVTEIYSSQNSELHYYKIQNEEENSYHVGTTQVFQEKDSRFYSVTVSWGGSIIRNNLNSYMNGENIECEFKGLYYLTGLQQVDNHTLADHASPHCHSNELYKGIIDDNSNAVFNGKILVRQDAQKTNAYQMNKNILLSDDAGINSKPQLEIFADDVKCSHGATTGQIDKEQLFYLKSRGIGEKEGKRLLLYAFANEILEEIKVEEVKVYLENMLEKRLSK